MRRAMHLAAAVALSLLGWPATTAAETAAPAPALGLEVLGSDRPGLYERIEFRLPAGGAWANPYDPADVEADLDVTLPSGRRVTVPAFFMVPFETATGTGEPGPDWLYPSGTGEFRARFAPSEAGRHTAKARLRDRAGQRESPELSFEAVPTDRKGYLRVSRRDPRFFGFDVECPIPPQPGIDERGRDRAG